MSKQYGCIFTFTCLTNKALNVHIQWHKLKPKNAAINNIGSFSLSEYLAMQVDKDILE